MYGPSIPYGCMCFDWEDFKLKYYRTNLNIFRRMKIYFLKKLSKKLLNKKVTQLKLKKVLKVTKSIF